MNINKLDTYVSFVLPHSGRNTLLVETVESIARQLFAIEKYEVIIVTQSDDSSRTTLLQKLTQVAPDIKLTILSRDVTETISAVRNYGASLAIGNYLAFIDSDIRLSENWVSVMIEELNNPNYALVCSVQIPDHDGTAIDTIRSAMSETNIGDENQALTGQNLFLRRSDFEKSDKFPEHLETCEDSVFTQSVLTMGKLHMTSKANFVHLGEDKTFFAMFKKEIWRSKSNINTLRGSNTPLKEIPSLIIPFVVSLTFACCLTFLVIGNFQLSALCLVSSFIFPVLFTVRLKIRSARIVPTATVIKFYTIYFVARSIGMATAIVKLKNRGN